MKLIFILLCLILTACDETSTPVEPERVFTSTDRVLLAKFISLPRQPVSVKWEVVEIPARGTGSLTALLEFTAKDKRYITNNSKPFELQVNDRINAEFYDTWLPVVAKSDIKVSLQGDSYELHGVPSFQPDMFTNTALSPYVNGSITPLATGYILVSLYSM